MNKWIMNGNFHERKKLELLYLWTYQYENDKIIKLIK